MGAITPSWRTPTTAILDRRSSAAFASGDIPTTAGRETLTAPVDVLDDMPAHDDHGAGRLAVGPDGKLYFSRGDQGSNFLANYCNPNRAQDVPTADEVNRRDWSTYQGKILRMNLDGSIPADNPQFAGVRSHIYAIGLRNTQGLVFGPGGLLYGSDHGPSTDDELNVIESGRNYGWPNVAGFKDDRAYVYGNWSASAPAPCRTLKFDTVAIPASVPQTKESAWSAPNFAPPLTTFFTVENDYDFRAKRHGDDRAGGHRHLHLVRHPGLGELDPHHRDARRLVVPRQARR